jgi:hypothetical protein
MIGLLSTSVALCPLVVAYGFQLWSLPSHRWAAVATLPAAALLLSRRRSDWSGGVASPAAAFVPVIAGALVILAAVVSSPWFGFVAWLAILPFASLAVGGGRWLAATAPLVLTLAPLVRLPFGLDENLSSGLRTAAARGAGKLLDLWNTFHVLHGSVISTSDSRLLAGESLTQATPIVFVLVAVAFINALRRRPVGQSLVVLASAPMWVVLVESVHMAVAAKLSDQNRINADQGVWHWSLCVLSHAVPIGLALSFGEVLQVGRRLVRLTPPENDAPSTAPPRQSGKANRWVVGASAIALGVQGFQWFSSPGSTFDFDAGLIASEAVPSSWEGFRRVEFQRRDVDSLGVARDASIVWRFVKPAASALLTVQSPVVDLHEPITAFRLQGWIVGERRLRTDMEGDDAAAVVEVTLTRPGTGQEGRLWFFMYDRKGNAVSPASRTSRWSAVRDESAGFDYRGPFLQISLFLERHAPLAEGDVAAGRRMFMEALRRLPVATSQGGGQ